MIASAVFTAFAAAFNLYIMRRGAMLVGEEARPFMQDLSAMPRLVSLRGLRSTQPMALCRGDS